MSANLFLVWALLATFVAYFALAYSMLLAADRRRFAEEIQALERERASLRRQSLYWQRMALGIEPCPRFDPTLPCRLPKESA